MKKLFTPFILFVLFISVGISNGEGILKHANGYYYIELENTSPKKANTELLNQIERHKWEVVHTVNIDKTIKSEEFYKTHLLCKAKLLKRGVLVYKDIGNLIPCKITIRTEDSKVKIMVEDIREIAKIYIKDDKRFLKFIDRVQRELNDILLRTKQNLKPKVPIHQY